MLPVPFSTSNLRDRLGGFNTTRRRRSRPSADYLNKFIALPTPTIQRPAHISEVIAISGMNTTKTATFASRLGYKLA